MGIHTCLAAGFAVGVHHIGGHCDHRKAGQAKFAADEAGCGVTVHHRHLDVHQHHIDIVGAGTQVVHCLLPICTVNNVSPFPLQRKGGHQYIGGIVFYQEYAHSLQALSGLPGRLRGGLEGGCGKPKRQGRGKSRALSLAAVHGQGATHQAGESPTNHQSQACAAEFAGGCSVGLGEGLK